MVTMLEVRDLRVRYGAIEAVRGIDLTVRQGELVALVGSNGAGKSTLLKALAGILRPVSGSIVFDGEEIAKFPAHRVVSRGIVLVPEGRRLFADQTVLDNLLLGAYRRRNAYRQARPHDRVEEHLDRFPVLRERRDRPAGTLSGGQQQMLAIGRALMANPDLVFLDEPSEGLSPVLIDGLVDALNAIRRAGTGILVVEQHLNLVKRATDRFIILAKGAVVGSGPTDAIDAPENQTLMAL
jgi:ABC-type branched-subunit amino acid transport system ATPase component